MVKEASGGLEHEALVLLSMKCVVEFQANFDLITRQGSLLAVRFWVSFGTLLFN